MIKAGIIGAGGYVAGELLRCLLLHPQVSIAFLQSHSQAGEPVRAIHQDLVMHPGLVFDNHIDPAVDVLFLALGHGQSAHCLAENSFSDHTCIIDMSNDFRLRASSLTGDRQFIYGLPEHNMKYIKSAHAIANPGCFATAIQLALLPLAVHKQVHEAVHVHATTGSTGAGQAFSETSHFSWRSDNYSVYKPMRHQHLAEINETIGSLTGEVPVIHFIPARGNFTRGIFASVYTQVSASFDDILTWYHTYYCDHPFVVISDRPIHLKQIINTNYALLHLEKIDDQLLITVAIDNLLKGAAGQAIQNMNIAFGFEQTAGLNFKANYF